MGIWRRSLSVWLLVSTTAACVTVNVHVGDEPAAGASGGGSEPLSIAGDAGGAPGEGGDAGRDVGAPGGTDDGRDGGGGGEWSAPDHGDGWVIVLGGGGPSPYGMPGSAAGDGEVIVYLPDETAATGDIEPSAEDRESPPDTGEDTPGIARLVGSTVVGIGGLSNLSGGAAGGLLGHTPADSGGATTTSDTGAGKAVAEAEQWPAKPTHPAGVHLKDKNPPMAAPSLPTESDAAAHPPPGPPVAAERVASEPAPAAPFDSLGAAIDAYLAGLESAAYTFNPPSPIKVARPHTVHLWLDPQATPEALAAELRAAVPEDAARVEAGETPWSPIMEATLTGSAFDIKPITPARQSISASRRTAWTWEVTATRAGEELPLYLTLNVILPEHLGPPHTVATLARRIDVEVTLWWAFDHYFDHYFDRYWKWLLGSVGTAFTGVIAWWWKRRSPAAASAGT